MTKLEEVLYEKVRMVMSGWDEEGIYAVSFFVEANMAYEYGGYYNVSAFSVGYNTEADCENAGIHSERRWNYAFWRHDNTPILEPEDESPEMKLLFDWYKEIGLENIGQWNEETGDPVGYPELVQQVANVARRFQEEGFLKKKFGRSIPIIVHDLEYVDCTREATAYANPNGEAEDFFPAWESEPADNAAPGAIPDMAKNILRDPAMLEKLLKASPWTPREYMMDMLKELSEQGNGNER